MIKLKKYLVTFSIAILIGGLFAIYIFKGIGISLADSISDNKAYLYQIGVFRKYNNAYKIHDQYPESIIVKDNSLYRVYIGISIDNDISKAYEQYYQKNNIIYYKKSIKLNDKCLKRIMDYEKIIRASMDSNIFSSVNKRLLEYYQKECL